MSIDGSNRVHQQAFTTRWRGRDLTLAEVSKQSGIPLPRLDMRYRSGKREEDLTAPLQRRPKAAA